MNEVFIFVVYAIVFRVAMISAGALAVFFGYRLFVLGVMPKEGSDIESEAGNVRLTIRNAAPGTCFALAGVAIIGLMAGQGNPAYETSRQLGSETTSMRGGEQMPEAAQVGSVPIGDDSEDIRRMRLQLLGKLADPMVTMAESKPVLMGLAAADLQRGRNREAGVYALILYGFAKDDPRVLGLNAKVEEGLGNDKGAMRFMNEAKKIDPDFDLDLNSVIREGLR
jgi:hypothetical protein